MIEYWLALNGRWYWHRVARNGEITDSSQGYSTASNCRRAFRARFPAAREVRVTASERRR